MDAQELQIIKYKKMTEEPVEKLVIKMAIPTIISMLITSFYNMADTFFVGRINISATAAVGVIFSLMAMIQAIGFCFGHGSENYISRKLGEQDIGEAEKMAATDFIFSYANDYIIIILIGAPFMISSFVLNNQLRLQGNAASVTCPASSICSFREW